MERLNFPTLVYLCFVYLIFILIEKYQQENDSALRLAPSMVSVSS